MSPLSADRNVEPTFYQGYLKIDNDDDVDYDGYDGNADGDSIPVSVTAISRVRTVHFVVQQICLHRQLSVFHRQTIAKRTSLLVTQTTT